MLAPRLRFKTSTAPDILFAADYYPGGMQLPGHLFEASTYRFGYQGQFAEKDDETGYNQFEARLYDTRINRWLTTDPAAQYWSPYLGMGNNWPNGVDPDGETWYTNRKGEIIGSDGLINSETYFVKSWIDRRLIIRNGMKGDYTNLDDLRKNPIYIGNFESFSYYKTLTNTASFIIDREFGMLVTDKGNYYLSPGGINNAGRFENAAEGSSIKLASVDPLKMDNGGRYNAKYGTIRLHVHTHNVKIPFIKNGVSETKASPGDKNFYKKYGFNALIMNTRKGEFYLYQGKRLINTYSQNEFLNILGN